MWSRSLSRPRCRWWCRRLPGGGKDQNVAVVDVGANVMNVAVLRNDQSVYTREQAFGGNQLTRTSSAATA